MTPEQNVLIEKLADILWQIGNERIGHRQWEMVGDVYLSEARQALHRSGILDRITTLQSAVTEAQGRVKELEPVREAASTVLLACHCAGGCRPDERAAHDILETALAHCPPCSTS